VRPESGDTTGVVTSTGVGKCDRSQKVRLESGYTTRVGHTIRVASSDRSQAYDRSHTYDQSCDIPTL
jgi:hypothetical protein